MENCLFNRRFLYIFLLISLAGFLVLPKICLADDFDNIDLGKMGKYLELSPGDAQKLMDTLKQVFTTEAILLWSSGDATEEKVAVAVTLLNIVGMQALSHLLVDAPLEALGGIIKEAKTIFCIIYFNPQCLLEKLEKESVKKATKYGMSVLFKNEIRVTPGAIKFKYYSYKGGEKEIVLQYVMIYKPESEKRARVAIRFYMPISIEAPAAEKYKGLTSLKLPDLRKDLPPFIVEVNGRVEKDEKFDNYLWINEKGEINHPSVNITFPPVVPDLGIKFLSLWEKYLLKPIESTIKEVEIVITKATGKSLGLTDIWEKVKSFISEIVAFAPAALVQAPSVKGEQTLDNKISEPLTVKETIKEVVEARPQQPQEAEQKLTVEEIQEILDDITERIDVINQGVVKLTGVEVKPQQNQPQQESQKEIKEETKEKEIEKGKIEPEEKVSFCAINQTAIPQRNKAIINEIAWMGGTNSANDEWIELKNISGQEINLTGWQILDKDQQIKIVFYRGSLLVNGFLLLERTNDDSAPEAAADFIYTGALSNTNEALYLFDGNCQLQDMVEANPDWPAGDNTSKRTMERKSDFNWQTSTDPGGTPKRENGSGYITVSNSGGYGGGASSGSASGSGSLLDVESPIAQAGPDQEVVINQPLTFDGSQSSDNIKITSYQWGISQDSQWDLEGKKVTYKNGYQVTGKYIVTLRVSDKAGNLATDTLTVTVILPPKILISEVQTAGKDEWGKQIVQDEFIELYNPNNGNIDLAGFALKKKTSTGSESNLVSSAKFSGTISSKGYFLIVPQTKTSPDIRYSGQDYSIASNNTILFYDSYNNLIDKVGFGQAKDFETAPTENPPAGQSIGRKWDETNQTYLDINDNSKDFEIQIPTPKAKNETFKDIISPETAILNKPGSLTNQTQAVFTFSSSEENSTFECRLDDEENWQICFSPQQQYSNLLDGLHTFQVRAKDISQNTDPIPAQYQWRIDTIPPQTEILTKPPLLTNQTQVNFSFSANEKNSTFECKLNKGTNEGNWETCQSLIIYENLTDDEHTFSVRAKDKAQNLDPHHPAYSWTIKTSIKSASLSSADLDSGSLFYANEKTVKVIISDDEDASAWLLSENQIKPEADNPDWQTAKPSTFTLSAGDGQKTVYIWTKDAAKNISRLGNSASIVLDTQTPQISFDAKPADPTNQTQAAFIFSSNEDFTFECQLDNLGWQNCSSPSTFNNLIEDIHIFQVKAADLAGNISAPLSYSWLIDLTPPEVSFKDISSPQTQLSFLLSWSGEGKFQFRYSDDETNWTYFPSENEYVSKTEYEFTGEDESAYYFQVKANDQAGNKSQWQKISTKISLPKPILEVNKDSLKFEGIEFGVNARSDLFAICNSGQTSLEWEIATFPENSWLIINPISGQLLPSNCLEVSVSADISELCSGRYLTKLLISSNGGSKEIETVLELEEDNIPPANADLILADLANGSNFYTQNRIVKAAVTNSQDASFWLLFEAQIKPEADNPDWQTAKPSTFTLSAGDGQKTVYIWTKDKAGNISELGKYASIILDTTPPIANAGPDQTVETNQPINFDASGSSDNVEIVSFKWDLDWNNLYLTGKNPVFQGYPEVKSYSVTLQVSDASGNMATDGLAVTVVESQPTLEVVINEIAWMGTKAEPTDEWIELYNNTANEISLSGWKLVSSDIDGPSITLGENHKIGSKSYFLIERTDDNTWKGSFGNGLGNNPDCEALSLYGKSNNLIDKTACLENGNWFAGQGSPNYISMERVRAADFGTGPTNWANNNLITRNGKDAGQNKINGTPRAKNSVSTSPTKISSLPFNEFLEITLTYLGSPYLIEGSIEVLPGKKLKIEPGVIMKFKHTDYWHSELKVEGELEAMGEDNKKIVFTSYFDDEYGGDTNQDANSTRPLSGDWEWIYIKNATSTMKNVILRYAGKKEGGFGSPPFTRGALKVENSNINFEKIKLEKSQTLGLWLENSTGQIKDSEFLELTGKGEWEKPTAILIRGGEIEIKNSIFKNNKVGILIEGAASPVIENNVFEGNEIPIKTNSLLASFSGNSAQNNTLNGILVSSIGFPSGITQIDWKAANLPFIIEGTAEIPLGRTLNIQPGVIIKFKIDGRIYVYGSLRAEGSSAQKIVFTSLKDDYGGDTNNDGNASQPDLSDWDYIWFYSSGSILDNVLIRYGGQGGSLWPPHAGAVALEKDVNLTFKNSLMEKNVYALSFASSVSCDTINGTINQFKTDNVSFENNKYLVYPTNCPPP